MASLFAEFFRDLDIVPSDIIAGLVLLRQRQRAKRFAILDQVFVCACVCVRVCACLVLLLSFYLFNWLLITFCLALVSSQANNDILNFLSGMPLTRNTKYLDLKNSVSFCLP